MRPGPTRSFSMGRLGRTLTESHPTAAPIHALFVVVRQPGGVASRTPAPCAGAWPATTCSPWSASSSSPTPLATPTSSSPPPPSSSSSTWSPSWGHLYLGWNEPAIAPLGEAVPNTELWRRLAEALGVDDPRFAQDDEALIRSALAGGTSTSTNCVAPVTCG